MSFAVSGDAYDRYMGRYSTLLSPQLADLAGIVTGQRVLDVGCGTGALTVELAARVGPQAVLAVDPSESFVEAARARHPDVDVRKGSAERLPFADGSFDATLAQLVVHFMADPTAGVAEMRRVTRSGGTVVACVWDHAGGRGPSSPLWHAARELDPAVRGEPLRAGSRGGDLLRLFTGAGLLEVEESPLAVTVEHPTFDEWWEPFTLGVGPAGAYVAALDPELQERLREQCRATLPHAPFTLTAHAWAARGRA